MFARARIGKISVLVDLAGGFVCLVLVIIVVVVVAAAGSCR